MTVRIPRSSTAVWRAIRAFGSQRALALSLGVDQQTISAWGSGDRPVPAERCPQLERLTRAQARAKADPSLIVTCEQLRPDIEWDVLRMQAAPEGGVSLSGSTS